MKYIKITLLILLFSSSLFAGVGLNAKIGYGALTAEGDTEGVLCYGSEIIYFSNMTLCGSIGFDAWRWADNEMGFTASLTNSSIILSLGVSFPKRKPVASIRGGVGLITWWKTSFSAGGISESDTETNTFKDVFGVFDIYVPISKNFDIVFQGKYAHQTMSIEESGYTYSQGMDAFSGKIGFQVNL